MRAIPQGRLSSEINVTPLVDVCLVLLIIFMVVTPLIVTQVPVELPVVGSAEPLARQPLQVTLTADGTLHVGSQIVRAEEAAVALGRERERSDREVVVQADAAIAYGKVADLLAICRAAGFSSVGLAAQRRAS